MTPSTYASRYQRTPYFPSTPRSVTPFIPDSSLYPPSPYSNSGSPNRRFIPLPEDPTTPNQLEFPTLSPYDNYYGGDGPWDDYQRVRRPSWQGFNDDNPWPHAARLYSSEAGVNRRHSFGATGYRPPYLDPGVMPPHALFTPLFINPWIDAELPRRDFYFDLALPAPEPTQLYENSTSELLRDEEAMQPAMHPPITRLKIIHPALEDWPIEIAMDDMSGYLPPPITVMDVLIIVHRHLHIRVSSAEYAQLTFRGKVDVGKAFTKRCKAIPTTFDDERADGLKRVDYLLGKTMMRGLLRVGHSGGYDVMKLVVTN
ncbi:hypothetical protein H0H87_008353 [Tephrocybe sp. NHM501043]|nr:hypothetical protein H0H87_008353 [Tephrocybe sp. NHM501043]